MRVGASALSEDRPEEHAGSVVRRVVSCQSTFSLPISDFQLRAVIAIPPQPPSNLSSRTLPVNMLHSPLQHKHTHCINMQIVADTQTRTFQLAAGSVQRLSQPLYRASLCVLPPSVNSAAHWCRTPEPDTHLLNRLARVFPGPASNSRSVPTLH